MENMSKWSDKAAGPLIEIPTTSHQAESRAMMNDMLEEMGSNTSRNQTCESLRSKWAS